MLEDSKEIFISYAWGGDSEEFVKLLVRAFREKGMTIILDKDDLGYKGLIKEFMERIGRGKCVIAVISDKYLKSPNCMFELVQVSKNGEFYNRIFPIVLADAQIYDPVQRLKYIKHWEDKKKELSEAIKEVSPEYLQGIREEIDQYTEIRNTIAALAGILKNMNTLTPDIHSQSDFETLFGAVERKLAESARAEDKLNKYQLTVAQAQTIEPERAVISTDDFNSKREVNYAQLKELLQLGKFKEADQKTADIMLEVAGRNEEGWLRIEDIEKFSCTDLKIIDKLWEDYSKQRFGLSIQQRIWKEVQAKPGKSDYSQFAERLGWCVGGNWLRYNDFTFTLEAARGHLPALTSRFWFNSDWRENKKRCVALFSRIELCSNAQK